MTQQVIMKSYPYTITLPINHGMGQALKWFKDNEIDFRWSTNRYENTVIYYFKNDDHMVLFALRWS
jgi:hypothetical protein